MVCPKCKADEAHRSHRQGVYERVASVLSYYPYRCRGCNHRFLTKRQETETSAASREHRATEREIRATRRAKRWHQRRAELIVYLAAAILFIAFLYFLTRERSGSSEGSAERVRPSQALRLA